MQFVQIRAENFKSFEKLYVKLDNHGFVKIDGVNNTDAFSKSVGSGKSTIADALSYALTGETIKGNSSVADVKNMYTKGVCSVTVDFVHNDVEYSIMRGENDLVLMENGQNISKHLKRDTQALIEEKFPMFTPTFLGATVIIGQNMPNSFTNNKPSARKQILEELTNSSFMIEEIKTMLVERKTEWSADLANLTTSVVVLESQISSNGEAIIRAKDVLGGLRDSKSVADEIVEKEQSIGTITLEIEGTEQEIKSVEEAMDDQRVEHGKLEEAFSTATGESVSWSKKLDEARIEHSVATMKAMEGMLGEKQSVESEVASLGAEISAKEGERDKLIKQIKELKSVMTHCPTCKQVLPDAHKLDTAVQEGELDALGEVLESLYTRRGQSKKKLDPIHARISKFRQDNQTSVEIEDIKSKIDEANVRVEAARSAVRASRGLLDGNQNVLNEKGGHINKLKSDISSIREMISELRVAMGEADAIRTQCQKDILRAEGEIKKAELEKLGIEKAIEAKRSRLSELAQVMSFASRDFRTILLTSIIKRLDAYAKAFCKKMLDTTEIVFKDDGNNIAIAFRGRDFGVLSGGESQVAKMCITLALKKTLEDLVGFTTNIIFLDEILDNCDQSTAQQIVELVAGLELSSTFFITHHEDVYLPIDRTWTVTKTNNISVLEVV